jgi:hypothetical protein
MNEETRYLTEMLSALDLTIANTREHIKQYPDDEALRFMLKMDCTFRLDLLGRIERAKAMDPYLEEVNRQY